jgi:hypothetical protein
VKQLEWRQLDAGANPRSYGAGGVGGGVVGVAGAVAGVAAGGAATVVGLWVE